jgi:erythromycin esterase
VLTRTPAKCSTLFERWPTWMWANEEVVALVEWLCLHNDSRSDDQKVGFYGLDVYSLWEFLYAIMGYLHRDEPAGGISAASRPYREDVQEYARATRFVLNSCEDEVVALLHELRRKADDNPADGW